MIPGWLFVRPTWSHMIFLEYPSMQPCIQNPYGFSLSYPSMCQIKFGPFAWYCRLWSLCLERLSTPSGSNILNAFRTNSLLTDNLWFTTSFCHILLYPTTLPLLFNSSSMASTTSSKLVKRRRPRFFFDKTRLSCRKLKLSSWIKRGNQWFPCS